MQEEYNISELNPRKNPYVDQLEKLIDDAILSVDDNFGMPNAKQMAEYLVDHGVVVGDNKNVVTLPCPIGTTLYRIDHYQRRCSYHQEHRNNLYYCVNDWKCKHLCDGKCDDGVDYKIHTISNADAMTILGNADWFGTRVFLDKEEAEKVLEKKKAEEETRMKKASTELPSHYECYRENWEEECEDDDD